MNFNSIDSLINHFGKKLLKTGGLITYEQDSITKKNAISNYALGVAEENLLFIKDNSNFVKKNGLAISISAIYWKEGTSNIHKITLHDLKEARLTYIEIKETKGQISLKPKLSVINEYNIEKEISYSEIDHDVFKLFLDNIIQLKKRKLLDHHDGIIPLENMSLILQEAYMKLIVNLVYQDDKTIDEKEMAEIQLELVKLNFNAEMRKNINFYIAEPNELNKNLLELLKSEVPRGNLLSLSISLIKDLIKIYRESKDSDNFQNSKFIINIAQSLNIDDEKLNFIDESIKLEEKLIKRFYDDKFCDKTFKEIAAKAIAAGVPATSLYISGSIMGLSAAGMSTGLIGLGFGSILGISTVTTGIGGAVLLLGVATYSGIKKLSGDEKTRKREFFLKEAAKIQQRTKNNLIEDINLLTQELISVINYSEKNSILIEKLAQKSAFILKTCDELTKRENSLKKNLALSKLPKNLNIDIYNKLTKSDSDALEYIFKYYDKNNNYLLINSFSSEQFEELHITLVNIGYFKLSQQILDKGANMLNQSASLINQGMENISSRAQLPQTIEVELLNKIFINNLRDKELVMSIYDSNNVLINEYDNELYDKALIILNESGYFDPTQLVTTKAMKLFGKAKGFLKSKNRGS